MQLATFGVDKERNLIVQFSVFIQPYTQQPLVLYQLEMVPVPIIGQNDKAQSYTHLQIQETIYHLKLRNLHFIETTRVKNV